MCTSRKHCEIDKKTNTAKAETKLLEVYFLFCLFCIQDGLHAKIFMVFAAFPVATAADLTGTSSGATSLLANEYTLMDSAHSSNKYEIPPTSVTFVRSPAELQLLAHRCLSEKLFLCLASELQKGKFMLVTQRGQQQSARKHTHTHMHTG